MGVMELGVGEGLRAPSFRAFRQHTRAGAPFPGVPPSARSLGRPYLPDPAPGLPPGQKRFRVLFTCCIFLVYTQTGAPKRRASCEEEEEERPYRGPRVLPRKMVKAPARGFGWLPLTHLL